MNFSDQFSPPPVCSSVNFTFTNFSPEPLKLAKPGTRHSWVKGIKVCKKKKDSNLLQGELIEKY